MSRTKHVDSHSSPYQRLDIGSSGTGLPAKTGRIISNYRSDLGSDMKKGKPPKKLA